MDHYGPSLREELMAMAAEDRRVRAELAADGSLFDGYHPRMAEVHRRNATRLAALLDRHGWPTLDLAGEDGAAAAWLVLQHAIGDPPLMRRGLELLARLAAGEVDPARLAMLEDRIRAFEGRPQRYGTQYDWDEAGRLGPLPVEDPGRVDELRRSVGERERHGARDAVVNPQRRGGLGLPGVRDEGFGDVDRRHAGPAPREEPRVVPLAAADVEPGEARDVRQHREEGRGVQAVAVDVVPRPGEPRPGLGVGVPEAADLLVIHPRTSRMCANYFRESSPEILPDPPCPANGSRVPFGKLSRRTGAPHGGRRRTRAARGGPTAPRAVPAGDGLPDRPRLPAREGLRRPVPRPPRRPGRGLRLRDGLPRLAAGHGQGVLRPASPPRLGARAVPPARRGEPGQEDRGPFERRPPHAHVLRLRKRHQERHGRLRRCADDGPSGTGRHLPRGDRGLRGRPTGPTTASTSSRTGAAPSTRYDKRFLSHSEVTGRHTPGRDPCVFEVDGWRFGCALCIEVQFPEVFREYADLAVDCVLLSAYADDAMFGIQDQGYAASHSYWVSLSTPTGMSRGLPSRLIAPTGEVQAEARAEESRVALGVLDERCRSPRRYRLPS